MLKIGLTGGIGSGKSLVCSVFSMLGIPVYEADREARRLMEEDEALIERIKADFGDKAYNNKRLNREYIAGIVFHDRKRLENLNKIVHPAVHTEFLKWSAQFVQHSYVIEEAAILFESGGAKMMDYIIFVKSAVDTRVSRIISRDQSKREDVEARIRNQMDDKKKEQLADFIIENEEDSMILPQIVKLHENLKELNKQ